LPVESSEKALPMLLLFVVLLSALTTSEMLDEALIVVEAEFTTAADQTALGFASGSTASSAITTYGSATTIGQS
jgi:hypothetical protein